MKQKANLCIETFTGSGADFFCERQMSEKFI